MVGLRQVSTAWTTLCAALDFDVINPDAPLSAMVLERPADQAVVVACPRQGVEYRVHVATVLLGR